MMSIQPGTAVPVPQPAPRDAQPAAGVQTAAPTDMFATLLAGAVSARPVPRPAISDPEAQPPLREELTPALEAAPLPLPGEARGGSPPPAVPALVLLDVALLPWEAGTPPVAAEPMPRTAAAAIAISPEAPAQTPVDPGRLPPLASTAPAPAFRTIAEPPDPLAARASVPVEVIALEAHLPAPIHHQLLAGLGFEPGAASAPAAPVALALAQAPVIDASMVPGMVKVLKIRLEPAHLGTLDLRLETRAEGLVVHIRADTAGAAAALAERRDELEIALRGAGIDLDTIVVRSAEQALAGSRADAETRGQPAASGDGNGAAPGQRRQPDAPPHPKAARPSPESLADAPVARPAGRLALL